MTLPHREFRSDDFSGELSAEPVAAWKLIDVGRYQPQRIRGSCLGRALG